LIDRLVAIAIIAVLIVLSQPNVQARRLEMGVDVQLIERIAAIRESITVTGGEIGALASEILKRGSCHG